MSTERKLNWNYNLLTTSENKQGKRTATPREYSYEAIGVDFSTKSGLRPFPGFKKIHSFTSLDGESNHTTASEVIDVFPISFRVGSNQYGYGFVYRAVRPGDTSKADTFIDYYIKGHNSNNFTRGTTIRLDSSPNDPMEVVVFGKYVYIMHRDVEPVLFYIDYVTAAAASCTITIANATNIQDTPVKDTIVLIATDGDTHTVTAGDDYTATDGNNNATATSLASHINGLADFSASADSAVVTVTQVTTGKAGNTIVTLTSATAGSITKTNFANGAGYVGTSYKEFVESDTGPGKEPELLDLTDTTATASLGVPSSSTPGNAHVFLDTSVGSYWDTTPTDQTNPADLEAGNYAIAYTLEEPVTGRKSSLSEIAQVTLEQMTTHATGKITVTSTTDTDYDNDTIIIDDGTNAAVTFTLFSSTTSNTGSGTAYSVGVDTLSTTATIVAKIKDSINSANAAGDLLISASQASGSDAFITLTHDVGTTTGNVAITSSDTVRTQVEGMTGAIEADPGYIGLEIVYDSSKYSKAHVYRSVRVQDAGGSYSASVVQLDKYIELSDYWAASQTGMTGNYKRAIYYYTLDDFALIYQDPYTDTSLFDENMPAAGAATEFDGILLTSDIGDIPKSNADRDLPSDKYRGLGEFRWSSIRDTNPELFPPENYYVPSRTANQIITFENSGGAVLGFAQNCIMHISRESNGVVSYLKVLPMHEGYGVINKNCVESIGPRSYYVNPKGLKSVDVQGRLDSLHALDGLIEDWKDDFANLSMAYDSEASCLFILNKTKKHAACMWFSTSMVSELYDLPFSLTVKGDWPSNLADADSDLSQRAMFLQNQPDASTPNTDFDACIWAMDTKREDTIANGTSDFNSKSRITTLHFDGDTRFRVSAVGSGTFTLDNSTAGHGGSAPVWRSATASWVGSFVYIISSDDESKIGKKAQIRSNSSQVVTYINADTGFSPAVGDRVSISPVFVRWSGSILGYNDSLDPQNPTPGGLYKSRLVDAASVYFSEVGGAPTVDTVDTSDLFYKVSIFEGDSTTAVSTAIPKDLSGTIVKSIKDGESTNWAALGSDSTNFGGVHGVRGVGLAPAIEIFVSDLDFRLLSCIIEGKILPTLRSERAT